MDLASARDLLGQHWSAFVAAVYDPTVRAQPGGIQSYVWQSLNNFYLSRGESLPSGSFQAVNSLLSLAAGQRQAGLNLADALHSMEGTGIDQAITGNLIAPSIDSRPLDQQPLGAQHRLIFQAGFIVDGQPIFGNYTLDLGYDLPATLGGLNQAALDAATSQGLDYGWEFDGSAVPVSILSY